LVALRVDKSVGTTVSYTAAKKVVKKDFYKAGKMVGRKAVKMVGRMDPMNLLLSTISI